MRIVETDNFGRDYPNESFVNLPEMPDQQAHAVAEAINNAFTKHNQRHWKAVPNDYALVPGFEP